MNCHDTESLLVLSVYGDLSDEEAAQLENHLESCPACQRHIEELRQARELVRSLPTPEPSQIVMGRILAQVREDTSRVRWDWNFSRLKIFAALCIMAAVGGVVAFQMRSGMLPEKMLTSSSSTITRNQSPATVPAPTGTVTSRSSVSRPDAAANSIPTAASPRPVSEMVSTLSNRSDGDTMASRSTIPASSRSPIATPSTLPAPVSEISEPRVAAGNGGQVQRGSMHHPTEGQTVQPPKPIVPAALMADRVVAGDFETIVEDARSGLVLKHQFRVDTMPEPDRVATSTAIIQQWTVHRKMDGTLSGEWSDPNAEGQTAIGSLTGVIVEAEEVLKSGRYELAEKIFTRILTQLPPRHPERSRVLIGLAEASLKSGNPAKAEKIYRIVAEEFPAHAEQARIRIREISEK